MGQPSIRQKKLDIMLQVLRHPKLNALLLGLLQGISQGLSLSDQEERVRRSVDENMMLVTCFGLVAPSVLVAFSHVSKRRRQRWFIKFSEYVNPYQLVFWGGTSFALCGLYSIRSAGASEGYAICAFAAAGGVGFLIGGLLERWLQQQHLDETARWSGP